MRMGLSRNRLMVGLGAIMVAVWVSSPTSATTTSTTASVNVAEACTMYADITTPHTATISPNTYQANIGITTINVTCNDPSGYAIYAVGYTGNTIGDTNSTKLVSTDGNNTINTGTATSGSASNWAMKLATSGSSYVATLDNSFGSYHAVPSDYTKVAHYNSATDTGNNATGSTLTTTYAAFVTGNQSAGTYLGKVKYTMVHPASEIMPHEVACAAGSICYNPNTTKIIGTMGEQPISASDTSATLLAGNFSRVGYGFAGWSDKYDYETNEDANFYGPNETITFTAGQYSGSNPGLSLYAVWVESAGSLQSNATTACNGLTEDPNDSTADLSSVTALTDERDNQTYAIAKLADGKCWMIENLRLENTGAYNRDGILSQGYNSSFIGLANPEYANFDSSIANSLYSTDGSTAATISGSNTNYRFPRYRNDNTNSRQSDSSHYSAGYNTYSYGNHYSWAAAIADTTHYSTNNQSITSTSLCPTGWRLPKGGNSSNATDSDFWNLGISIMGFAPSNNVSYQSSETNTVGDTATKAFRKYPNNFIHSGYSNINKGNIGRYWSSTVSTYGTSYCLEETGTIAYPGAFGYHKAGAASIRCILGP